MYSIYFSCETGDIYLTEYDVSGYRYHFEYTLEQLDYKLITTDGHIDSNILVIYFIQITNSTTAKIIINC